MKNPLVKSRSHAHPQQKIIIVLPAFNEAANIAYLGLHALQHRGQESAGIVTSDGEGLFAHRAMGLVQDVFGAEQLSKLPGRIGIGHSNTDAQFLGDIAIVRFYNRALSDEELNQNFTVTRARFGL